MTVTLTMWQLLHMNLKQYVAETKTPAAALARDAGCGRSYITHILADRKTLSRAAAIRIWQVRGVKLDPIANATDEEIEVLARFSPEAA